MMAAFPGSNNDDSGEMHEINVTPLIDVMLVLLIVFMIAAPLSTVDVKVDLPVSSASQSAKPDRFAHIAVTADGRISVNDAPTSGGALGTALDAATEGDKNAYIFLRADRAARYEILMSVMDGVRAAGYSQVGLVGLESGANP